MHHSSAPETLLEQLLDLERLDQIPRTGFLQRGVEPSESVVEHSWHVATIAWTLLPDVQPIDDLRVLELALLHDVGELTLGDIPKPGARLLPPGAKRSAEIEALRAILRVPGSRRDEIVAELAAGTSREARFVHACDRLQLLIKTLLYARWNRGEAPAFLAELLGQPEDGAPSWIGDFAALGEVHLAARQLAIREGLVGA